MRDNPPKNKILVVGRRGVGKLSLVHAILGSRFIPTTSASKSRPASPLLLPATTIPPLEESKTFDGPSHHIRQHHYEKSFVGNTTLDDNHMDITADTPAVAATSASAPTLLADPSQATSSQEDSTVASQATMTTTTTRSRVDHSGVTIPWTIDTKYYTVKVDFWIDETDPKGRRELEHMIDAGDLDEIGAVVEAVVFCFSKNDLSTFHDIKPWITFVERMEPSITLCVATDAPMQPPPSEAGTGTTTADHMDTAQEIHHQQEEEEEPIPDEEITDYDDWCLSNGFEYVDLQETTEGLRDDEHVGLDRILEALAAHMWDGLKRKSNKKQGQHTRNMIRSFSVDPDGNESSVMDLSAILGSQSQSHASREYFEKLASTMTHDQQQDEHGTGGARLGHIDEHGEEDDEGEEDEESEDEDDDEEDDRAFYKALAELSMHSRAFSPLTSSNLQREHRSYDADVDEDTTGEDPWTLQHSGDQLEQDLSHQQESRRLSRPINNGNSVAIQDLLAQDQERQAEYYLNRPFAEVGEQEKVDGRGGDPALEGEFSLQADGCFEFGQYMSAPPGTGGGGDGFDDDFMDDPAFGGVSREMVEEMHQSLFGGVDDEDGMARTLDTLRSLREQGKNMPDKDRRELAARVALSFGMQMDQ